MLLVKNGYVKTMTGVDYNNGYILTESTRILKAGNMSELDESELPNGIKVIDATGMYIMPGLVDAHSHIGLIEDSTGFEGDDANEATEPVVPHLRAIDGVYPMDMAFVEARKYGITTVIVSPGSTNVIGGQIAALKTYGNTVDKMIIKEPTGIKIAFGENPKAEGISRKKMPVTRMAIAALLRDSLARAAEYKQRIYVHEQKPEKTKNPGYDMKLEALAMVLDKKIPLVAHAHRADDILTAIRIAKEFQVDLTIEHCTEGHFIADILAEEKINVITGPLMISRTRVELRNHNLKVPGILSKAGIQVAIASCHPSVPAYLLCVCAALAVKEGMSEEDALKGITMNAAKAVGISHRVGSIEMGKDADIVIFDRHPFNIMSRVIYTIINGEIIYAA